MTERTNHTYISSYVPIGRDATVSWGGPDFKFKNNRDYPIKIEASYANSKLTCKIIGTNVDGSYVKFTSERTGDVAYNTKYENDATIPEGQQVTKQAGSNGEELFLIVWFMIKMVNCFQRKKKLRVIIKVMKQLLLLVQ